MRNLTKTLTAISLLAPVSAYPLGIGDIKLHSALNQNLNADIALIVSADENIADLRVRLAPPEKFDEAGVPWSYFLSKIKFKAVMNADGTASVKLTSQEALREPFLDFLIEVSWPKGNLFREFTVLVDPPVAYTQPITPVIQQPKQISSASSISSSSTSVQSVIDNRRSSSNQHEYTRRADSLWKVADRTNAHSDVSIEQMMMAIFEANPGAFYKNNVNALKAGQRINIPKKDAILKLSKKAAISAFRKQNKVWKGQVAKKRHTQPTNSDSVNVVNTQLELEAPVEGNVTEKVVVVAADVETTPGQLDTDKMGVETSGAGQALQARMEKLEKQLMMMQKMLLLKDEQIASLQTQEKSVSKISEKSKTQSLLDDVTKGETSSPKAEKLALPNVGESTVSAKKNAIVKPKVIKKLRTIPPVVEPETDIVTWILGGVGAIILAILGLIFWRRRKVEEELDTESMFATASEISLPDSSLDQLDTSGLTDTSSYDVGTVGESSFLSEFTPSDFDAFDTEQNEVDPISEADVYLAYGRYQQAEDLMRQAIEEQPERDECKIKLLEIFYANENKDAFKGYINELVDAGKQNDSTFWSKVSEMGAELDPESSLYGEKSSFEESALESDAVTSALNSEDADIEETVVLDSTASEDSEIEVPEVGVETEMDFDMSIFDQDESDVNTSAEPEETVIEESIEDNSLDFDLNTFEDNSSSENNVVEESQQNEEPESIEFDFDATEVAEDINVEEPSLKDSNIELLEFETEEIDSDSTVSNVDAIDSSSENESLDTSEDDSLDDAIEEFEFDFDMGAEDAAPSVANSLDDIDLNVSDLTDTDELETKIDLAKAYIDMGDPDAAKNIAEEVLEKGTDEQKSTAQEIIDQLK